MEWKEKPAEGTAGNRNACINQSPHYTANPAENLLSRLDCVKETGPSRWLACCPAHDDRTPSLSLRELDDGTLLIRCWAGCDAGSVMAAVGLNLSDLFPRPSPGGGRGPLRRGERWVPRDVLRALAYEALIVGVAADDVAAGRDIPRADCERAKLAASRIKNAVLGVCDER